MLPVEARPVAVARWAAARPPEFWQGLAGAKLSAREIESLIGSRAVSSETLDPGARRAFEQGAEIWLMEDGLAPGFLFLRGSAGALERPMVGIVGTRQASAYGVSAALAFAKSLAAAGITVVSGGARGIDTAAHVGALETGLSVAVLPGGVDVPYPAGNRELFERIVGSGGLVSEFSCGSRPVRESFLVRNRTLARLASALLVIEAPSSSGALVTARHALSLGKTVFVVPGPFTLPSFQGGYGLLEDGARLAPDPSHLASLYGKAPVSDGPSGGGSILLGLLASGPMSAEALGRESGLEPGELMEALTTLELEGSVTRAGDGYACTL